MEVVLHLLLNTVYFDETPLISKQFSFKDVAKRSFPRTRAANEPYNIALLALKLEVIKNFIYFSFYSKLFTYIHLYAVIFIKF